MNGYELLVLILTVTVITLLLIQIGLAIVFLVLAARVHRAARAFALAVAARTGLIGSLGHRFSKTGSIISTMGTLNHLDPRKARERI